MASCRCPMCHTPCIVKIIATEDERYREVDVCQMCGAMYPHEGKAAGARPVSKGVLPRPRRPRGKAKPGKRAKRTGKPKKRKAKAKPRKKAVRKAKKRSARRR
jgi:hypothetical protein